MESILLPEHTLSEVSSFIYKMRHTKVWPEHHGFLIDDLVGQLDPLNFVPIFSCMDVGGKPEAAVPVAAIWYVLDRASHIIDAILDHDELLNNFGSPAEALNYSLALLFSSFDDLVTHWDPVTSSRLTALFSECGFDSAHGYLLSFQKKQQRLMVEDALEKYWRETILKSGSVYRCAAQSGALVTQLASNEQIEALGRYGYSVGVMLQVLDDCRDADGAWNEIRLPYIAELSAQHEGHSGALPAKHSGGREKEIGGQSVSNDSAAAISSLLIDWRDKALASLKVSSFALKCRRSFRQG